MPTNRQTAIAKGLKQYESERPCLRGHMGMRFVGNKGCVQCHNEKRASGEWKQSKHQTKAKRARRRGELRTGAGMGEGVTTTQIKLLGISQGWRCAYCGIKPALHNLHLDHKNAISEGGQHTIENLQFLCEFHNVDKGALSDDEYRKIKGIPAITPWDSF